MEIKILIFSILMQGASITKTILYSDSEYISIEEYSVYNTDSISSKVSYYISGAENLVELSDDVIYLTSNKLYQSDKLQQSDSWIIAGEEKEDWAISLKKLNKDHLELNKSSSRLIERAIFKKINISKQISKTIPLIVEHEDNLYVTTNSSTTSNGIDIFHVELMSDRVANNEEVKKFNRYKEILKQ